MPEPEQHWVGSARASAPRGGLRAAASAGRGAPRALGRTPVAGGGGGDLARDLAGGGTPLNRDGSLHARFEQIHPFLDGNGRAGRLVLNLLLVRLGYPPAIIYKGNRRRYLAALRRADQGDLGPLGEFLARAVLDNLYKFIVPAVAGPARLVPLPALAMMNCQRTRSAWRRSEGV